jgi:DNA-binding response OmpR family regulator
MGKKIRHILLIEDDTALGEASLELLQSHGHDVRWVVNADGGYKALAQKMFDVVILDLGLGMDNGITLISALRRHGRKLPPLIIFSAQPMQMIREAVEKTGAVVALQKPCTGSMIEEAIEFVLRDDAKLTARQI